MLIRKIISLSANADADGETHFLIRKRVCGLARSADLEEKAGRPSQVDDSRVVVMTTVLYRPRN
jgi:hypothetical protein